MPKRTCSIEGCERPVYGWGWCNLHYQRWHKHGDPGGAELLRHDSPVECSVDDCDRKATRRGWCKMHYRRWQVSGDPLGTADRRPRRSIMPSGYVRIWQPDHPLAMADGYVLEHRKVWYDAHGEIPAGWHVHHENEDKTDNRLGNLWPKAPSSHLREHIIERGFVINQFGRWPVRVTE